LISVYLLFVFDKIAEIVENTKGVNERSHKLRRSTAYNFLKRDVAKETFEKVKGETFDEGRRQHSTFFVLAPWLEMVFSLRLVRNYRVECISGFDEVNISQPETLSKFFMQLRGGTDPNVPEAVGFQNASVCLHTAANGTPHPSVASFPFVNLPQYIVRMQSPLLRYLPSPVAGFQIKDTYEHFFINIFLPHL
jgi:hypothetical protein